MKILILGVNGFIGHHLINKILTEKKAMTAASRSIKEWMASEIILIDPLIIPVTNLRRIKRELEMMDNRAVLVFSDILRDFMQI